MSDIQPWYKQFWPWFLILLPLCAVVASINLLFTALDNSDSLVAEDYYKEGKAINMDLRKINYAKQIGMQYQAKIDDNMVEITQHGGPAYTAALNIDFYHRTIKESDIRLFDGSVVEVDIQCGGICWAAMLGDFDHVVIYLSLILHTDLLSIIDFT